MAINEKLTSRVRELLVRTLHVAEKKMFSGITFMNDKMCISVGNNRIMCRVDPALHDELIHQKGCTPVLMKGREYKGFIYVSEEVLKTKKELDYWVQLCVDYNQYAKASKKKKK